MVRLNSKVKFKKIIDNVAKAIIILLLTLAIFDKANLPYIREAIIKLDAEYICTIVSRLAITFRAFAFDLPMLCSIFVFIFNFVCVFNCLLLIAFVLYKAFNYIHYFVNSYAVAHDRKNSSELVENIYLLNGKFRC